MAEQIKFGDKLFLKGETLIIDNGASDAIIMSKNGTLRIEGDLTVQGITTTVLSETVNIQDNQILLNSNFTGPNPTEDAGIEIERGDETNSHFLWQEASSRWTTGAHGLHSGSTISATTFSGNLTGSVTGDITSTGISTFTSIDINGGNIDGTVIGATNPQAGTFTTLNATTINGAVTGTVSNIANHDTDDLAEGTNNLYYTQARVDARYAQLQADSNFIETLDGQAGSYYLDYNNFTNIPSVIGSIDDLSDVDITTVAPTTGQTITWNGSNFVPGDSFSQSDFDTAFTAKDTDDLSEGSTNLYYTDARVGSVFDTRLATKFTDDLAEGSTNLYYTDARARAAISATGSLSYNSSTGVISYTQGDTDTVTEGTTNLYYTTVRANAYFDTRLATKSTTDLAEGTNLYYTTARDTAQFNTDLATKSTTDLAEGTNLYYTDARARAVSLENIVEDTTPQLGGNLDLNTFDLTTTDPTVTLTTTTTPVTTQGTIGASTETNLSNATVTVNDDGDYANAVSSYITLTSTQIDTLGFKGDISLTYFGEASSSSNFVFRDTGDSIDQNQMITTYAPPTETYTFTLSAQHADTDSGAPGNQNPLNISSADTDIKFKQSAYGEMTVTSSTVLSGSTIQLRDAGGFYIDKEHVEVTSLGGTSYKIVFWTHEVSSGDVIDIIASSAQTAIFEWGTSTFSETGLVATAESFSVSSSTNDIFAMGDLNFTTGSTTGEVVGTLVYDSPTNNTIISGLSSVSIDGTTYQSAITNTQVPIVMTGNSGTSNELSLAVGSGTDARLWLLDGSANLIYKLPGTDGTANQVMKTDGSGDVSWTSLDTDAIPEGSTNLYYTAARDTAQFNTDLATKSTTDLAEGTNLYYTDARADARAQLKIDALVGGASAAFDTLVEIENAMATDTELTNAISALNHDSLSGFVSNEHIDWTTDQGTTNIHAGNYTNTTYISSDFTHDDLTGFVANEHIDWTQASAGTIDPSNYANTGDTTYTAGSGLSLVGTEFSNSAPDQTVSLTGAGATTVSGTYPNFTITSTDTNTSTDITGTIIPATDNTYDLGSTTKKYANIYGHTVQATYADLAERYAADGIYEAGTVVVFGGEAEITTTQLAGDVSVAGVISTNPALKLNADAGNSQTHPYVALRGRVPCQIIGPVSKGDLIITAHDEPGYAKSNGKFDAGRSVFAKSIETDLSEGKKVIEVVIL